MKLLFLVIFICALPFNIHPARNCFITFIEEIRTGKISSALDQARENNTEPPLIEDVVSDNVFVCTVISLQLGLTVVSCIVQDMTVVFGIIAVFSEVLTNNILPGIYLAYTAY